jgi:hypothetical protein
VKFALASAVPVEVLTEAVAELVKPVPVTPLTLTVALALGTAAAGAGRRRLGEALAGGKEADAVDDGKRQKSRCSHSSRLHSLRTMISNISGLYCRCELDLRPAKRPIHPGTFPNNFILWGAA